MEDAVHAMIMAFSVIVFIIGLTIAVYMFQQITSTADNLLYYSDRTNFYDNIELNMSDENALTKRIVDMDTIIPTIYRYYKENFCVKIYDAKQEVAGGAITQGDLIQIFDVNLEGEVRQASAVRTGSLTKRQQALKTVYNDKDKQQYLFEAPWIGSTDEDIKTRIDMFINGSSGYINNTYVDYRKNKFNKIRKSSEKVLFSEEFINYTYSGETMTTDDGDVLIEGTRPKDKIIIIYTAQKVIT